MMGLDFVRRCAPTFHKTLDRRAIELRTPTLFSKDVTTVTRTAQADVCDGSCVAVGEKLLVRSTEGGLVVQRAEFVVAKFCNPPADYLNLVRAGAGIAGAEIKAVHPLSGVVEVSLCE